MMTMTAGVWRMESKFSVKQSGRRTISSVWDSAARVSRASEYRMKGLSKKSRSLMVDRIEDDVGIL